MILLPSCTLVYSYFKLILGIFTIKKNIDFETLSEVSFASKIKDL